MRKIFIALSLFCALGLSAENVSQDQAKQIAEDFLRQSRSRAAVSLRHCMCSIMKAGMALWLCRATMRLTLFSVIPTMATSPKDSFLKTSSRGSRKWRNR